MAIPLASQLGQPAAVHRLVVAQPSDAQLVAAARLGQLTAQGQIWDRYAQLIRRILQRSLGPDGELDDALQDTFITLFGRLDELRDAAALRAFLIGIAMRVASAQLRRRQRRRLLTRVLSPGRQQAQRPADHPGREALRRLYELLDELSPATRLAFVLRYIEGLPQAQVAAALNTSLATTKRRLAKARAQIEARAANDPVLRDHGAVTIPERRGER